MLNWFEGKIKFEETDENGAIVKVAKSYLIDALSFTEAEARLNKEMKPFISGEFVTTNIRRARINELFANANGDTWYKSKVWFISLDEEKGIEKRTASTMMVQANNVKEAWDGLEVGMKGTMADYKVASIVETAIEDVFYFEASEKQNKCFKIIEDGELSYVIAVSEEKAIELINGIEDDGFKVNTKSNDYRCIQLTAAEMKEITVPAPEGEDDIKATTLLEFYKSEISTPGVVVLSTLFEY